LLLSVLLQEIGTSFLFAVSVIKGQFQEVLLALPLFTKAVFNVFHSICCV